MIIGEAQITKSAIYVKLSQKYAQLNAIDTKQEQNQALKIKEDYFDISNNNYDKNDYERVLEKFKSMDSNIRSHEQAHASSGTTTTPIQYSYQVGPDGKMYATGGHVRLDTSIPSDPKSAAIKLDQIKRSATSSVDSSSADMSIASSVNLMKMRLELESSDQNKLN